MLPTGLLRAVSEEYNLALACVKGKLVALTPHCHVRYGFLYGCFFVGVTAED